MRGAARFFLACALGLACAAPAGSPAGTAPAAGGVGAKGAIDCDAAPGRPVNVFLEGRAGGDPRVVTFEGVTFAPPETSSTAPGTTSAGSPPRYTFTDREGGTHRLAFFDPDGPLPVVAGRTYSLTIETVMGMPSTGAIVLSDGQGLLLAAAGDTGLGETVLAAGPPGVTLRLADAGCRGRAATKCFEERVNQLLEVTHDGATVRLAHGQKGRLGAYEVSCHAAERVKYSPRCADAGVLAVSWSIRRK